MDGLALKQHRIIGVLQHKARACLCRGCLIGHFPAQKMKMILDQKLSFVLRHNLDALQLIDDSVLLEHRIQVNRLELFIHQKLYCIREMSL
jgi:hypothetical protein